MALGVAALGESVHIYSSMCYRRPEAEIAVFYGFDANLRRVFKDYRAAGRTVIYVDLGYWGRKDNGKLSGYHKVVVNGRHPTAYFQSTRHPFDRAERLNLTIQPWRRGGEHIMVAGMSAKCAEVEGFRPSEWESLTIEALRKRTDRQIIYRPKPSWAEASRLQGAKFEPEHDALPRLLENCHCVVTHHSNVAIDGILAGVPAFTTAGAAGALALSDLDMIESPIRPEGREQFIADLAYTQWTTAEMRTGHVWWHLKNEGLIP